VNERILLKLVAKRTAGEKVHGRFLITNFCRDTLPFKQWSHCGDTTSLMKQWSHIALCAFLLASEFFAALQRIESPNSLTLSFLFSHFRPKTVEDFG
jgi:hypothetical protein